MTPEHLQQLKIILSAVGASLGTIAAQWSHVDELRVPCEIARDAINEFLASSEVQEQPKGKNNA